MAISNNKISQWVNTDVVDAAQMNDFTQDLYQRLSAMTDFSANRYPNNYRQGVILAISGTITQSGRTITVGNSSSGASYAAAVRFPTNNSPSVLQPGNGVFGFLPFGNAPQGNTITVPTGSAGYVIINYTITAASPNTYATNLVVPSLLFITTGNLSSYPNCVVVATILANGNIDQTKKPNYLITQAADANDITALANNVALTPASVLPSPVQRIIFTNPIDSPPSQYLVPPADATGVILTATAFGGFGGGNIANYYGGGGGSGGGFNNFNFILPLDSYEVSYVPTTGSNPSGQLTIRTKNNLIFVLNNGQNGADATINAGGVGGTGGAAVLRSSAGGGSSYIINPPQYGTGTTGGNTSDINNTGVGGASILSNGQEIRAKGNTVIYGSGGGTGGGSRSGSPGGYAIVIAEWVF